jgi:hypothetical protein
MPTVARLNQYGSLQATEFDEVNATNSVKVNTSGTFFSTEFEENIDITFSFTHTYNAYDVTNNLVAEPFIYESGEISIANVYSPYNIISGDFAIPEYGPGGGTYMSYLVNHRCLVYNEIDEITGL